MYPGAKEALELAPYWMDSISEELWAEYEALAYEQMHKTDDQLVKLRTEVDIHTPLGMDVVDIVFGYVSATLKPRKGAPARSNDEIRAELEDTRKRKRIEEEEEKDSPKRPKIGVPAYVTAPRLPTLAEARANQCNGDGRCLVIDKYGEQWIFVCMHNCKPVSCRLCGVICQRYKTDANRGTCDDCTFGKMEVEETPGPSSESTTP